MKAKFNLEVMELDDGLVAVPVGEGTDQFNGVLKVNETAAAILKLLRQDTTEDEIVENLLKEYMGDKSQIADYVHEFIQILNAEGVLDLT